MNSKCYSSHKLSNKVKDSCDSLILETKVVPEGFCRGKHCVPSPCVRFPLQS